MFYTSIKLILTCLLLIVKVTQEEKTFHERIKRDTKLLGTWKFPLSENTNTSTTEIDGINLTASTNSLSINNEINIQSVGDKLSTLLTTTTTETVKTIHFLKPSDIISATGVRTVVNIPHAIPNSTHEVFIIANDGNATVIKGHNSVSIKASTTIE